jgi:Mg2+/Co2+ transporter CorC
VLTEEERAADIDTVGGLVFTLAGRVPARGELISHGSGIEFRGLEVDARRIVVPAAAEAALRAREAARGRSPCGRGCGWLGPRCSPR